MDKLVRIVCLAAAVLLLISNVGCESKNDNFMRNVIDTDMTDITGNIFGVIVRHDDWFYYANIQDKYKLYKIKTDGTMRQKLNNANTRIIGTINDWVYYENRSDKGTLYKIKNDGSENTKLVDDEIILSGVVLEDWVYYISYNNEQWGEFSINIISADGSKSVRIADGSPDEMVVDGDWIYYTQYTGGGLYKIRTDGSEKTKLYEYGCSNPNKDGDWIYFIDFLGRIMRVKDDGSKLEEIVGEANVNLTVKDGWVYYHKDKMFYRKRPEETREEKIYLHGLGDTVVEGDWVYAINHHKDYLIFRINVDGSTKEYIPINY